MFNSCCKTASVSAAMCPVGCPRIRKLALQPRSPRLPNRHISPVDWLTDPSLGNVFQHMVENMTHVVAESFSMSVSIDSY